MPNPVVHQPDRQRFVIDQDGMQSLLEYRMLAPDVIDFVHTYTPAALRGQGHAARLVESGVSFARAKAWRIIGSCSYVAAWLQRETPSGT